MSARPLPLVATFDVDAGEVVLSGRYGRTLPETQALKTALRAAADCRAALGGLLLVCARDALFDAPAVAAFREAAALHLPDWWLAFRSSQLAMSLAAEEGLPPRWEFYGAHVARPR